MQHRKGHFCHDVVKGRHVLTQLHGAENNHAGMCIVLCPSIIFSLLFNAVPRNERKDILLDY